MKTVRVVVFFSLVATVFGFVAPPLLKDTPKNGFDRRNAEKGVREELKRVAEYTDPSVREAMLISLIVEKEKEIFEKEKALTTANQEIGGLITENERITEDTELAEFLLFTREALAQFENQNSRGCPEKQDDFIKAVNNNFKMAKVDKAGEITKVEKRKLQGKTHFCKWVWILLFGDETKCKSIAKLRKTLGNDLDDYLWFATQMENIFGVLCGDVPGKSPLEVRHMKKEKFPKYVKFFTEDPRSAVLKFLQNVY